MCECGRGCGRGAWECVSADVGVGGCETKVDYQFC